MLLPMPTSAKLPVPTASGMLSTVLVILASTRVTILIPLLAVLPIRNVSGLKVVETQLAQVARPVPMWFALASVMRVYQMLIAQKPSNVHLLSSRQMTIVDHHALPHATLRMRSLCSSFLHLEHASSLVMQRMSAPCIPQMAHAQ